MLRNKLYYGIKPLVPLSLRRGVRRWFACRKRSQVGAVWPILPGSERPPAGWPGWPDGKKFAFVLTHDVEGQRGLDRVPQLMEVEKKFGFRSSFNFIPEGEYRIGDNFPAQLARESFEIGIHDLHHDGKLFASREAFAANASRINQYLQKWNAVGFRAGFMFHRLDWYDDLEILYDASTFDTDPFEPQPDGEGTIFPFWKPKSNGRGYVELPYTLPQDSTLFLLFRERTPEIWLKKLDWIAQHGGMALVNVHPDYVNFDGHSSSTAFSVDIYEDLLRHVKETYGNSVWLALPKEVAAFTAALKLPAPRRPKRICMVTYSAYLSDARVTRYAESLAERGDHVDVLSVRQKADAPDFETVRNVNIYRRGTRLGKNQKKVSQYFFPITRFLCSCAWWIARRHRKSPYDLLHIHNIPDFLVFAASYPKLTGARVILDIHDIVPEFYSSKFGVGEDSAAIRCLKLMERVSARCADHIIISNHLWLEKYSKRTKTEGKCSVYINNVNMEIFRQRPKTRGDSPFIIIFPGGLQWHQGVDIALRAFQKIKPQVPEAEFHIYGDGNVKDDLKELAAELGLNGTVKFCDPVPVRQVAEIMSNADLGVVPKRADSFGNEAYSTKIMEFMSLGVPVVVSETKIDRYYFNDSIVRFFKSGDADSLADALREMICSPKSRQQMAGRALAYAAENSWERRKIDYLKLVDAVCSSTRAT